MRSVKTALHVIIKDQAPKEEVLLTALIQIEHSINSRPLTHVSVDPRDQEALTPNHFLIGRSSGEIKFDRHASMSNCTRGQWLVAGYFAEAFWRRWLREYLPTLLERNKWQKSEPPLKVGDLVLILDLNTERNEWRKGIVTRIYPSNDDQIRMVDVKTELGVFTRSVRKLVKFLEVQDS